MTIECLDQDLRGLTVPVNKHPGRVTGKSIGYADIACARSQSSSTD